MATAMRLPISSSTFLALGELFRMRLPTRITPKVCFSFELTGMTSACIFLPQSAGFHRYSPWAVPRTQ
jgi:hypothetical protein